MENLKKIINNLPDTDKNICIALSGGLDSTTLVHVLVEKYGKDKIKALCFDFGQRHKIEIEMAKKTSKKLDIELNVIKLDYLKEIAKETSSLIEDSELKPKTAEENAGDPQVNTYVPFRNLQFASITAAYAEAKDCEYITLAVNSVDQYGYWDTSIAFKDAVNEVLALNRENKITFIAPFVELYKDEELRIANEISKIKGYDILETTWSCYNGDDGSHKECGLVGKCNTCMEKILGYVEADFTNEEIMKKFKVESEDQLNTFRKNC
jgi:7-cyano-7-deazaguanine synthase